MITIRPSSARGHVKIDWLDTRHTFSFGSYYDPQHTGFGNLLVINEDVISPGKGFGTHGHQNMEIVTYVIDGELEHRDSIGNGETITGGEVQRMSAGTGIRHSEFNHSPQNPVHLLQIWIIPDTKNLEPSYEQKIFPPTEKYDQLCLLASPDARDNSLKIHQNVDLWSSILTAGKTLDYPLSQQDYGWLQVVKGKLTVNGAVTGAGDGVAIKDEQSLNLTAQEDNTEFLLFHFQLGVAEKVEL